MKKLALLLFPLALLAQPQPPRNIGAQVVFTVPSGTCSSFSSLQLYQPTNSLYGCLLASFTATSGTWTAVTGGGGGGGGTVTSVGFSSDLGTAGGGPVTSSGTLTLNVTAANIVGKFTGCSGTQYLGADGACHSAGSGTVTSVGYSTNLGSVSGSPVTSSGTITNTVSAANVVSLFSTCSGTQYLGADGACHTPSTATGTVTSIATTSPISGGTITTTGTISCPTCVTTSNTGLWTVTSNDIYNTNSGNVGIGGAPGNYKLDISQSGSTATMRLYDQDAMAGQTRLIVRAAPPQSASSLITLQDSSGTDQITLIDNGSINASNFVVGVGFDANVNGVALKDVGLFKWSSTSSYAGTADTGFGRLSAGLMSVNDGITGTAYRDLKLRDITINSQAGGGTQCAQLDNAGKLSGTGSACGSGGTGTVTTTGSPANGNLTKFSGASSITNGDLAGDVTTSGTLTTTVAKVNGVSYGASPSTHTVPIITASNTATYTSINDCTGTGKALTFVQSTDSFGCNTITAGTSTHYLYYRAASDDGASANRARTDASGCSLNSLTMLTTAAFTGGIGEAPNAGCTTVHVFRLPSTWDGNSPTFVVDALVGTTSTNVFTLTPVSQCYTPGTDAYASGSNNTGTGVNTTPTGTAFVALSVTLTIPITNCAAGDVMAFGFTRSNSDAFTTSVFWVGGTLTIVY